MFKRALSDNHLDVVMVGDSLLNPLARRHVLPLTQKHNVGTLGMFAVRRALTRPDALRELLDGLIAQGRINPADLDDGPGGPLGFLGDVVNAGYRFCRHEPGVDVALFGTGNIEHLETNLKSINDPPLPPEIATRLEKLFGHIDDVSGN